MVRFRRVLFVVALIAASLRVAVAQEAPPKEAFKAVHLVNLKSPAEVDTVLAALADFNAAVAKAGHPEIRYRLYKVAGKQTGPFNYTWESAWPSGEVYTKVHQSEGWIQATKKHASLDAVTKGEVYNRYVEVSGAKK